MWCVQRSWTTLASNVINVALDGDAFAAVKADGTLWTWGVNSMGQLGMGFTPDPLKQVKEIKFP